MNYLSGIRYVINNYIFTNNNEWKKIMNQYLPINILQEKVQIHRNYLNQIRFIKNNQLL